MAGIVNLLRLNLTSGTTLSTDAATLSFDAAATIDTSGNNDLTLNAGTADLVVTASDLLLGGNLDMVANGNRIDLDTDNDTSIRASADDVITVEVGGTDLITINATGLGLGGGPNYRATLQQDQNGWTRIEGKNATDGTGALAVFQLTGNHGEGYLALTANSYTSSNQWQADALVLSTNADVAGGIIIASQHASSSTIKFYNGSTPTLKMQLTHAGVLLFDAASGGIDMTGTKIDLDADGDTSITADTDDQIDFEVGGSDKWAMLSTGALSSGGVPSNAATSDGAVLATGGVAFTDVANAWIDDATHGAGTVVHYIGNETIDTTASDERLKKNIVKPGETPLEHLNVLSNNLAEYDYKNGTGHFVGIPAQRLSKSLPDYVLGDKEQFSVRYHYMVGPLLWGWKDQEDRIKVLEDMVQALKNAA